MSLVPASIRAIQASPPRPMVSFHGSQAVKDFYLARLRAHRDADEVVKGQYWRGGRGCAVGCTLHSDRHDGYETELGLPIWLAYVEDLMFERLPIDTARQFPLRFLDAIPVGADLGRVKWKFLAYLMEENIRTIEELDIVPALKATIKAAILGAQKLHLAASAADQLVEPSTAAGSMARSAEAARSAARSAAQSAARRAWSMSRSAESAVARSAESAVASAVASAAASAAASLAAAAWSAESAESAARWAWSMSRSAVSAVSAAVSAVSAAAASSAAAAWSAAWSSAESAARSAEVASSAAARWARWAESAESAAALWASWVVSAEPSAEWVSAAWTAAYARYADKLLTLLAEVK